MDVVDKFYAGYGEMRPEGKEIDPGTWRKAPMHT